MEKGIMRTALKNFLSSKRPAESIPVLYGRRAVMPFPDRSCMFCGACADACRTGAISVSGKEWTIDIGKCISCRMCRDACMNGSLGTTEAPDYVLDREDLVFRSGESTERKTGTIDRGKLKLLGRSVSIREVDTGSCNSCEVEVNSLFNRFYDVERFGLKIVASPRHADAFLVTGPLTDNMREAFGRALNASPDPKVIIAMGTCAISGGLFTAGETSGGITEEANVDMFIPGCPPAPDTVIRALLSAFRLH